MSIGLPQHLMDCRDNKPGNHSKFVASTSGR